MKHSNYDWRTAPLSIAFYGGAMDSLGATGKGLRGVVSHLCMTSRHEFPGKNWASPSLERLFYQKLGIIVIQGFADKVKAVCKRVLKSVGGNRLMPRHHPFFQLPQHVPGTDRLTPHVASHHLPPSTLPPSSLLPPPSFLPHSLPPPDSASRLCLPSPAASPLLYPSGSASPLNQQKVCPTPPPAAATHASFCFCHS